MTIVVIIVVIIVGSILIVNVNIIVFFHHFYAYCIFIARTIIAIHSLLSSFLERCLSLLHYYY